MSPPRRLRIPRILVAILLPLFAAHTRAQLIPTTWSGTGDWSNTSRWSLGLVPLVTNSAQISSGTATVSDARSVGALVFSGGAIDGTGTLTLVSTGSTWTAGTMNSAAASGLVIQTGADLTLSGTAAKDFNRRTITNNGTVNWQGGQLRSGNGGGFVNSAGAIFNDSASNSFNAAYGGSSSFTNQGTYNKTATGTTTFSSPFTHTGTVNLTAGTLQFDNGGSAATGSVFNVGAGTTLNFSGGTFTLAGAANLALTGTVTISGGTTTLSTGAFSSPSLTMTSGTLNVLDASATSSIPVFAFSGGTFNAPGAVTIASLTQSGGSLAATTLALTGNSTWSSGDWSTAAASTATIASGMTLTLSGTNVKDFNRRLITSNGTFNWQGGQLRTGNGGGFVNAAGAIFNDSASNFFNAAYGGSASFTNQGTYNKTATGTTTIQAAFANTGTVNLNAGTLSFDNGGSTAAGSLITMGTGTTLGFGGGTFTIASASTLALNGNVTISGGTTTLSAGAFSPPALTVTGGIFNAVDAAASTIPTIVMSGGTFTTAGSLTTNSLTFSGGTLTTGGALTTPLLTQTGGSLGASSLSLTGNSTWSSGDWSTAAASTATLASGITLTLSGTNVKDFNRRTITNNGTVNWQGGQLRTGNGGGFVNAAGAIFHDSASSSFNAAYGGSASFTNHGTYNKTVTGTTSFSAPFINHGTLHLTSGTLLFDNGGSTAAGSVINIGAGTTLNFSGGTFALANASTLAFTGGAIISGGTTTLSAGGFSPPTLTMTGGTFNATDATATSNLPTFAFSGGTFTTAGTLSTSALTQTGGSMGAATLSLTGNASWSAGDWSTAAASTALIGSGVTLTLSGANVKDFNRRTITNVGTVNWQGGQLRSGNGGGFINNTGATFNDSADNLFNGAYGGSVSFANSGTYNKNGPGTTTFQSPFNNSGTLNLNAGTLAFDNGGSATAGSVINIPTGTTLRFGGGNFSLATSSTLAVATGATTHITGGTTTFAAGTFALPTLNLTGGTLDGGGTLSTPSLVQNGGALELAALTLTGSATWNSGNWNSTIATVATIASGATLTLATTNVHDFNRRTITNNGTVDWTSGQLRSGNGGGFINAVGATLNDSAGNIFSAAYGGAASFSNLGTYHKSGTGTSTFQSPFNNDGTVNLTAGTFALTGGGSAAASGTFATSSGTTLNFGGGTYTLASGASLTGSGTVSLSGGTLAVATGAVNLPNLTVTGGTLDGPGTATIAAFTQSGGTIAIGNLSLTGDITWSSGTWNSTSPSVASIAAGKTLTITDAASNVRDYSYRTITNHGTVNWHSAYLRSGNGGGFVNAAGGTFNDLNASSYTVHTAHGGTSSFTNHGNYIRNAAGTTYFDVPFHNHGALSLQQGDLQFRAGGTLGANGTIVAAANTNVYFTNGFTVTDGSSLSGAGNYRLTGGTLTVTGTLNTTAIAQTSGTLAGLNAIVGTFNWHGGDWNATAAGFSTTIATNGILNLTHDSNNIRDFNRRAIINHGVVNWHSGYIRSGNDGSFTNAANGTFNDFNSHSYAINNPFGGAFAFINQGVYNRNATGTSYFDVPFDNQGTINLQQGDLQFRAGGTLTTGGRINTVTGTNVYFTNSYNIANGASLVGAGTYWLTAGTLTADGTMNVSTFRQTGGVLTGSHTLNGAFHWSGGNWNAATPTGGAPLARTTIASSATLHLTHDSNNVRDFNLREIVNHGTVNWHSGYIRGGNGSTFTNAAGAHFNDFNSHSYAINNPFGGSFTFLNQGTYTRNATGTTYFDTPFENQGAIILTQGDLHFRGGGTLATGGTVSAASGTNVVFTNSYSVANAASLLGAGTYWLTGGTLTASGTLNVSTFNQTGGVLTGTNTINGAYTWSGGNWNAATPPAGSSLASTTIAATATLNLTHSDNNVRDFNLRDIVNLGTVNWHSGYIRGGHGSTFTNAAGANFNDFNAPGYTINNPFGGTFTFLNQGTYTRNATGTSYFDSPFDNHGTIILTQGDLQFRGGGTLATGGTINAASGTNVYFTNSYSVANASSLLGAGTYWLTGGTLTATGTINVGTFNQTGGSLSGTNTINGTFTWSGGNWNSSAPPVGSPLDRTTIAATATLNLTHDHNNVRDFNQRAIVNLGTVNWHTGYIRAGSGSTFTNAVGATFNDFNASGYTVHNPFGGSFEFINHGTYIRNTAGTTYFDSPFHNHGTLNLVGGDIHLRQGGIMAATSVVNGSAGTHLYFTNNYTLADGSSFVGAGLFNQTGGTLTIDGKLQASSFTWSGGNWNAAANSGLTTTIAPATTLLLTDTHNNLRDFYGRSIVNQGVVNWHTGYLRAGQGSTFTNAAGGHFNDLNSANYTIHNPFGGSFAFVNDGTYTRNTTGTTYFDTTFNNNAALNLLAGDIQLRQGGTMSASSVVHAAAGTHLYITNSYTLADGARFTGPGLFNQTGGTLTLNGALTASNFTWSGGNWNAAANSGLTSLIAAGTTLTLTHDHDNVRDFYGRGIQNQGTINWQSGYLRSGQGGSFVNATGGVFNDQNTSGYTVHNPFGGTFTFTNNGTYRKASGGATVFSVPFTNNGTLSVTAGAVIFNSTFTNNGALTLGGGATIQSSGAISMGTSALTGTGTINATSVTAGGLVSPGNSAGTLTLTGNLTLLATSTLLFELGGGTPGSGYDVLLVGGSATLAGNLSLHFLNGYQASVTPGATFTVFTASGAGGLTGSFANIVNGQNLLTADGTGFFRVNYGTGSAFAANSIVLSNFVATAVPEPSTYAMLGLGALVVFWQVRRRRNQSR